MMKQYLILIFLLLMIACQPASEVQFKNGDILFRGKQNGGLSSAIDEVTQTGKDHHYTHMGVVEVQEGNTMVWHAAPNKGVVCETLDKFQGGEIKDSVVLGHYRIKEISDKSISRALDIAGDLEGQKYDFTYILDSEGYYCSEFVYKMFENDGVFVLEPMTFINPSTSDFHQGWVSHYEQLGIKIPEGLPGCNPNGMAASSKLELIGYLKEIE